MTVKCIRAGLREANQGQTTTEWINRMDEYWRMKKLAGEGLNVLKGSHGMGKVKNASSASLREVPVREQCIIRDSDK